MKDYVDAVESGTDGIAIADISFDELDRCRNPGWFPAAVGVRLEIIEHANFPAFGDEQIGEMRADEARATGNKRASFLHDITCPNVIR